MPEPVNAAIKKVLFDKAIAFAAAQSPVLTISLPNGVGADGRHFKKPTVDTKDVRYLKAAVLSAPALATGISYDSDVQHYGFLQIDVVQAAGGGTAEMDRIVSAIREYFPLGLELTQDGFKVRVSHFPTRRAVSEGPLVEEDKNWVKIPVSVPWHCFETPT